MWLAATMFNNEFLEHLPILKKLDALLSSMQN